MKFMVRKIISVCMLIVVCMYMTISVSASEVYTYSFFNYVLEGKSVTITDYFGKETEVTVPSMIVGYPVSKIASGAFSDSKTVKHVNLPDTIMEVEGGAFSTGITVLYNSNTDNPVGTVPESETSAETEVMNRDAESGSNEVTGTQNQNTESSTTTKTPEVASDTTNAVDKNKDEYSIEEAEVSLDDLIKEEEEKAVAIEDEKSTVTKDNSVDSKQTEKASDEEDMIEENESDPATESSSETELQTETETESESEMETETETELLAEETNNSGSNLPLIIIAVAVAVVLGGVISSRKKK